MPVPRSPVSAPQATLPASLCRTPPPSWPGVQGLPPGEAAPGAPVAMGAPHFSVPADGGPRAGPERGQQAAGGRAAGPRRGAPGIPRPRRASARAVPKPTAGQNQLEWLPGGRVGNGGGGAGRDGGGLHPPARPGPLAARGGAPPFRADGTPPSAPALSAYPPARRGGLRGLAPAVSDSARSLRVTPRESRSRVPCSDCSSKSVRGRADSCDGGVGSRENRA